MVIERFAPSPTGLLHLGHAYSAWLAWQAAHDAGGKFLLRFEDLDTSRVRPHFVEAIEQDLKWLGLGWDSAPIFQSQRNPAYQNALAELHERGLTYCCTCTRADIRAALSAPQEGAPGPDGPVYPGTCRDADHARTEGAIRLNIAKAAVALGDAELSFQEIGHGTKGETGKISINPIEMINTVGDVVLSRRDGAIAYHLAVVVDDADAEVTHVTRGQDLFIATPIHVALQALLNLPTPVYRHHSLVRDDDGKRLAKRDDARAISAYRAAGLSADQVLALARNCIGPAKP